MGATVLTRVTGVIRVIPTAGINTKWSRHERRVLRPFRISDNALEKCAFAVNFNQQPNRQEKHYVAQGVLEAGIRPKFNLHFDEDIFCKETDSSLDNVRIAIVARDTARRDYQVLQCFDATSLPGTWQAPENLICYEGIEFQIAAYMTETTNAIPGRPWRMGSVVAKKAFSVRPIVDNFAFPIASAEFNKEDLWMIHWQENPDYNDPVDSILELRINSRAHNNLQALLSHPVSGDVLLRMIVSQVCEVIARTVLSEYDVNSPPENEDGLAFTLMSLFQRATGFTQEVIVAQADDADFIRQTAQSVVGLTKAIAGADLRNLIS